MKILILGAGGMLGHALWLRLQAESVLGTLRSPQTLLDPWQMEQRRLISGVNALCEQDIEALLDAEKPDVLINCVGIIKQLPEGNDSETCLRLNALLPHVLARLCRERGCRMIHISTDCVFTGQKGQYTEDDQPDAADVYGRTKALGEVCGEGCLTLRTSIIGHELKQGLSLVEWFLAQEGAVRGFSKVLYSGLPTVELARVIQERVLSAPELEGLFQVAARAIDKEQLLRLLARSYGKEIEIQPVAEPVNDKTLVAERFRTATGYVAPEWPELISNLNSHFMQFRALYAARSLEN